MSAAQTQHLKGYRISYITNAILGSLFLLVSVVTYVIEMLHPELRGTLTWGFLFSAIVGLAVAAFHHNRYLHLLRLGPAASEPRTVRHTSSVRLLGLPLYDIYFPAPNSDIKTLEEATARGIFAMGMCAKGVVAVGVLARGGITFGVCSLGVISVGVCSISLLLAGGVFAMAPYAFGVVAIGYVTAGVAAAGWKVLASVG